jgi:hypothetical protein
MIEDEGKVCSGDEAREFIREREREREREWVGERVSVETLPQSPQGGMA